MNQQEAQQIAITIRQQINAGGIQRVWSWGSHAYKYGITTKNETEYPYPYLMFRVKGFKLKGVVRVVYNTGADTYYIEFYKGNKKERYKMVDNVYCEDLTEIIDREVETDNDKSEEYLQKTKEAKYSF